MKFHFSGYEKREREFAKIAGAYWSSFLDRVEYFPEKEKRIVCEAIFSIGKQPRGSYADGTVAKCGFWAVGMCADAAGEIIDANHNYTHLRPALEAAKKIAQTDAVTAECFLNHVTELQVGDHLKWYSVVSRAVEKMLKKRGRGPAIELIERSAKTLDEMDTTGKVTPEYFMVESIYDQKNAQDVRNTINKRKDKEHYSKRVGRFY